jgi:hypothetical protein
VAVRREQGALILSPSRLDRDIRGKSQRRGLVRETNDR